MKYIEAEYIDEVEVEIDGKTERLHVWRNPETGNLVAIDNMGGVELPRNFVNDPYHDDMRLVFHDTFSGLPK
jgi:hypothetical protein